MIREIEVVILLELAFLILLVIVGFTELFERLARLRPRIVHVHQGGREERRDDDGVPLRA
jgi:hypothetical protein